MSSLNYVCRTCQDTPVTHQCEGCHTAFYCGKECGVLDWNKHRKFCLPSSNTEFETIRREFCLNKIHEVENFLIKYLFAQQFQPQKKIFAVLIPPKIFINTLESFEELQVKGILNNKREYKELLHEVNRNLVQPTVVVLYSFFGTNRIYVLGSADLKALNAKVKACPPGVLETIQYYLHEQKAQRTHKMEVEGDSLAETQEALKDLAKEIVTVLLKSIENNALKGESSGEP